MIPQVKVEKNLILIHYGLFIFYLTNIEHGTPEAKVYLTNIEHGTPEAVHIIPKGPTTAL